MALFIWNKWRYDVVAGMALMAAVYSGVVPMEHAFEGFAHPAVITVASVLVISQALQASGIVSIFLRYLAFARSTAMMQVAANCGITALLSAFMNNIGALALMLPITVRDARKAKRSPSKILMPLSFASLLGGLVTLIGTPPNIVIATYRENQTGQPFGMFDFTPVGLVVAIAGIAFLTCFARFLLPHRGENSDGFEAFRIAKYVSEMRIPEGSGLINRTVGDLEKMCDYETSVVAIVRHDKRRLGPHTSERLEVGDILILQGASESMQPLFEDPSLLEAGSESADTEWQSSEDVRIMEVVVMPDSVIIGRAFRDLRIHARFGVNLLALAREGHQSRSMLKHVRCKAGDVLLLQGEPAALAQLCSSLGCLAIKNRGTEITPRRGALLTPLAFAAGILAAAIGLVPVQIAFTTVVGVLVLSRVVSLREAYRSIEWPVIVLLGFLIPVGEALQSTGATELISGFIQVVASGLPLWGLIAFIMAVSMLLSDVVHNTPTAVLMAPIAYSVALKLNLPPDALLMAVAIGAASPYLTPIGHQSNTLVMGPGGYHFRDYWRLGAPLDLVILLVAVPMVVLVWG
jgi:di/tricarboxylate transporter